MRISSLVCLASFIALAAVACGSGRDGFGDESAGPSAGDPNAPPPGSLGNGSSSSSSGDNKTCAALVTSAKKAQVDIIVLIDTSGSMAEETNQVKTNINNFASTIGSSGLDYTVIMIAEKPKAPPIPLPIPLPGICVPAPLGGANCADNPPLFHHLDVGVGSTDSLQILLDRYPSYSAWLRPNAYKVFVEVTDDNSALGWQQFDTQLLAKSTTQFGDDKSRKYIFDSICGWKKGTPVLDTSKCGSAENVGDQYQNLSKITGGIVDSVCESDYSGVFNNLAKGLVTKLGCEFAMPADQSGGQADPTAVVVKYTPAGGATKQLTQVTDVSKCGSVADAWYYDDNAKPTKILFCPTTCASAGADTQGKVEVAVGCKAPPPK